MANRLHLAVGPRDAADRIAPEHGSAVLVHGPRPAAPAPFRSRHERRCAARRTAGEHGNAGCCGCARRESGDGRPAFAGRRTWRSERHRVTSPMPPTFIGCAVENFRPGRPGGFRPDAIVLHRSGGSRESWRARFNDPAAQQSAHYVVGRDGSIDQYVLEGDTAFHAGLVVGATWKRLQSKVNPNFYTLGVELEGGATDDWPDAQVGATARLVADLAGRWQFAIDAEHVVRHSAIRAT